VDYIITRRPKDKPWFVMFGLTPYNMGFVVQPTDNQMRNLSCLAKVFADDFNFGFMDFREGEKVFEAYDVRLDYGRTTPALFVFNEGLAYPAKTSTLSAQTLAAFAQNYTVECQYCGQQVVLPRSELGMYLEYAKNEVANSQTYVDTYNFMLDHFNNTWVHDEVMSPYFWPKIGNKLVGYRLIFWVIVPFVLNSLFFLCLLAPWICCCCYKSSVSPASVSPAEEDEKAAFAAASASKNAAKPGSKKP
jgi:hypothetical protein